MSQQWKLGNAELAMAPDRKMELVLIDYDGPQLALFKDRNQQRYIGLASKAEDHATRWIQAPISILEIEALCDQGVTMRNAVCKPELEVIDYIDDKPKRSWRISPEQVPAGVLPVIGAHLPRVIGAFVKENLRLRPRVAVEPMFRVAGRVVRGHQITFIGIGVVTQALQRLWSAIADVELPETAFTPEAMDRRHDATTLVMAASARGSFGLKIAAADSVAFEAIGRRYKQLVSVSPDAEPELLVGLPMMVLKALHDFLKTMEDHGIELLANWPSEAAYVGASQAERLRPAVARVVRANKARNLEAESGSTRTFRGYFEGFNINTKKFDFFDSTNDERINGLIASTLAKSVTSDSEVNVGHLTLYDIQVFVSDNSSTLTSLLPVQTKLPHT